MILKLLNFRAKFWIAILVLIFALAVGGAVYFYFQYQSLSQSSEAKNITTHISQFYDLPNETPSVATVNDKSKLSKQSFFARAENGDKVLIFSGAGKAILYRPSDGKIVNIAPTRDVTTTGQ